MSRLQRHSCKTVNYKEHCGNFMWSGLMKKTVSLLSDDLIGIIFMVVETKMQLSNVDSVVPEFCFCGFLVTHTK